ncbi:uncharacterized protein J4E79_010641 [Alternaria viburni]|uniref:uncharacterized protein n=1 Tax=Alternaria viburni TaxID=566460 RepID=UPI0020C23406|nr:uncharacterized protein J4E79_010641 [Alternaria viburni]KAI4646132.1 hypothetical protein J4E79_010641 [Alternaria viburni]
MSSTCEKTSEHQSEETLKATILSHARAVFGEHWPKGCEFDVIISDIWMHGAPSLFSAWVIVYPDAGESNWVPILDTFGTISVSLAYDDLIRELRRRVADVMGQ